MTDQERRIHYKYGLLLLLCAFILAAGCDQTFEPLQKNDKFHFSIYGTLDAAVDTQWIRIGVPRGNINERPDPAGITVILEHIETGQSVVMQDSLFAFGDLLNYWTTMSIEIEHTYRIRAERNDGKSSVVTVTIPKKLPTPLVVRNSFPSGFNIYISDSVEHLADIQTKWYVILNPESEKLKRTYTFTYRNTVKHTTSFGGAYFTLASLRDEREAIRNSSGNADIEVLHRQFFVASAGPEWIDTISTINDIEFFLTNTASNVENGLGFVVGIDSKWMPYKTCLTPSGSNVVPCEPEEPFWR